MGVSKRIILSEERIAGKVIKIFGGIIGVSGVLIFVTDVKLIGISLFFLTFAMGIYFIGAYQDRKYKMLGRTPLELDADYCKKNKVTKAKITINRNSFNKVQALKLCCIKNTSDSTGVDIIWENTIEPTINFVNNITLIEFDITIPKHLPESTHGFSTFFNRKKYSYEVSFKFTESMEFVERTWKIPVKIK